MAVRTRQYWKRLLTNAFILTIWILHKLYLPAPAIDKRLEHVATQLDIFAARDQLAIELLPLGLFGLSAFSSWLGFLGCSLQLSCALAEALELVAAQSMLISLVGDEQGRLLFLADALIAVSSLLTLGYVSLFGVWMACLIVRTMLAFREIGDTSKSIVGDHSSLGKRPIVAKEARIGFNIGRSSGYDYW